jgi:hypothetical protein
VLSFDGLTPITIEKRRAWNPSAAFSKGIAEKSTALAEHGIAREFDDVDEQE